MPIKPAWAKFQIFTTFKISEKATENKTTYDETAMPVHNICKKIERFMTTNQAPARGLI